ncbi:MAG: universal stress protein [Spirochaetaceae bacterium]|nr:universal stress protein [Spirochaetaceae bacterium]
MTKGPIQRILVFIDGSEESLVACEYSILLTRIVHARLIGAYVVNTRALSDLRKTHIFLAAEEAEYARDIEEDAHRYLEHATRTAASKGVEIETIKTSGSVHQELLRIIEEKDIDLLVIGELAHVRSRLDEFYNESERLMRSAPCSVLIVKDEDRVDDLFTLEE